LLLTVPGVFCQNDIDWNRLLQDIIRLDSCIESSTYTQQIMDSKDSLLIVRYEEIKRLESQIIIRDTISNKLLSSLRDCSDKVEELTNKKWWQELKNPYVYVPIIIGIFELIVIL